METHAEYMDQDFYKKVKRKMRKDSKIARKQVAAEK